MIRRQWLCQISPRRVAAPKIATLPDNNPICTAQEPSFEPGYDDSEDRDMRKEGRDDIVVMSSINAVDIHRISWSPAADVQVKPVDDSQDDDPDAIRAQVDTDWSTCELH